MKKYSKTFMRYSKIPNLPKGLPVNLFLADRPQAEPTVDHALIFISC